jgi:transcriptional regulator with XRE-family HTH domain
MSLYQNILDTVPTATKKYVNRQLGFAATVSEKLKSVGMTQRELAEKMGKKESYISRILSGEANPTLKTIAELEDALGEDVISFSLERNAKEKGNVPMMVIGENV